jgi:hypothetical protein
MKQSHAVSHPLRRFDSGMLPPESLSRLRFTPAGSAKNGQSAAPRDVTSITFGIS